MGDFQDVFRRETIVKPLEITAEKWRFEMMELLLSHGGKSLISEPTHNNLEFEQDPAVQRVENTMFVWEIDDLK
jgi:hypothetical protein